LAEAYLTLIIGILSRRYDRKSQAPVRSGVELGRVLSWLEKNLAQPVRVADLAKQAGMSERSFHRAFRSVMGETPIDYLVQERIRRAARLLGGENRRGRISEVAEACGFEDSNYFSRCFRRIMGCSPRQFSKEDRTLTPQNSLTI
jgi:transcriptional regulator GlxA family with amidase domain